MAQSARNLMLELAENAWLYGNWDHYKRIPIGQFISRLPKEKQEILKKLKSDDLVNVRMFE